MNLHQQLHVVVNITLWEKIIYQRFLWEKTKQKLWGNIFFIYLQISFKFFIIVFTASTSQT